MSNVSHELGTVHFASLVVILVVTAQSVVNENNCIQNPNNFAHINILCR